MLLIVTGLCVAGSATHQISGVVVDTSGRPVELAHVRVGNSTTYSAPVTGGFIVGVSEGKHEVTAQKNGYKQVSAGMVLDGSMVYIMLPPTLCDLNANGGVDAGDLLLLQRRLLMDN